MRTVQIPDDYKLVSFDVKSLFTSIQLQLALQCTETAVTLPLPTDDIMDLLNLCLTSTYFQYNGKHYKQLHGTAMGSPVSVVVAEIVMQNIEERALTTCRQKIPLWLRYVDDTFTAVHKDEIDDFHKHLSQDGGRYQRRGADVGSDHRLVTACLKLKLKSAGRPAKGRSRFDVGQLKQPSVRKSFILEVRNRFEALVEMDEQEDNIDDGVNRNWKNIVTAYSESSKACLGYRQRKPKEWMSHDTWKAIENRRRLKRKVMDSKSERLKERHQEMYRAANKEVKGRARADKRRYMENLTSQAEEAAARNEQGTVYKITKIISGKCHTTNMLVKDKNGTLLTSEREQEIRWMEHFKEVLNRPPPTVVPSIQEATIDLDVNTDVPTRREVIQAINSLKNGKAPGNDNLNAELFKADPGLASTILTPLFTKIWEQEEIPSDWGTGVIIKIPKKGSLSDCNNWRGVTLLSVPSKIFCKVIIQRITKAVDDVLRNEQAKFRKGRRCADQIFTLRNILEQCSEWNRQLYVNFIDYEKAFDSIHRDSLRQILRAYGIPQRIVNIIKCFYSNFTCCVGQGDLNFEIKPVYARDVSCHPCYSILLSTGAFVALWKISVEVYDGPLSLHSRTLTLRTTI